MSQSNEDAAQTEAALLAQEANNHRNVVVLLFSWKEDEDGAWAEVQRLEAAFRLFNFTVKTPLIPKRYPQRTVYQYLERIEQTYSSQDTLLIVYYLGHAVMNREGDLMLAPKE